MNADSFDFNINNYSISDLENFLNLNDDYTTQDINKQIGDFSNKITSISDIIFKTNLKDFIEEVRSILTTRNKKNNIIAAGSTFVINDDNGPAVQQVFPTDIARGNITILKKKTTITTFCVNSLFRDISSNSATDCIYYLPYVVNNVTSMQVISMEVPQGIYLFSQSLASNTIYFKEYTNSTVTEGLVVFPQGNYPSFSTTVYLI